MDAVQPAAVLTTQGDAGLTEPCLRWAVCRSVLGVILIAAALLKAYELATVPLLGPGPLNQRGLLAAVVEVELVFGGWLLAGAGRRPTWAMAGGLWLAFLGVAGYEAVIGAELCGCFGRVRVDPRYTAAFDLAVVLTLPFCRPPPRSADRAGRSRPTRWVVVGLLGMAGMAFGVWDLSRYSPARLAADGLTFADGTVVLEPAKWVGRQFTLAEYINVEPDLTRGDWVVLLYRYDCEHCQRAVPRYAALAAQSAGMPRGAPSIALVEIPPYAPAGQELVGLGTQAAIGRLSADRDWFASTPVRVRVHDGIVMAAAEGDAAEDPG